MSKKQESVFGDPKPGRKNIWLTREIKAIIKAKIDKGEITNFSNYVESLILEKEKQNLDENING